MLVLILLLLSLLYLGVSCLVLVDAQLVFAISCLEAYLLRRELVVFPSGAGYILGLDLFI